MLILTRRVGETLMIGDEVSVTVLGVKGNQVRLGVNAPKDIAVHREEIYQRILHERGQEYTPAFGMPNYQAEQQRSFEPNQNYRPQYQNNPQNDYRNYGRERFDNYNNQNPYERGRKPQMNHLENRSFGLPKSNENNAFNPSFDPFEDDYYNR